MSRQRSTPPRGIDNPDVKDTRAIVALDGTSRIRQCDGRLIKEDDHHPAIRIQDAYASVQYGPNGS